MVKKESYLIDANVLITASRLYYASDLISSFWEVLAQKAKERRIILLDLVKEEIDRGEDELKNWLNKIMINCEICRHIDGEIIAKYAEIMQYIQMCGYYNEKGLNDWARKDIADPWLIAAAAVRDYTVITFEESAGYLSVKNKSGKVKIPDIAKNFNVEVHNLFYMMRQLNIKI